VTDRGTDGQTDRRTGVGKERAIAYMLSRAKNCNIIYNQPSVRQLETLFNVYNK